MDLDPGLILFIGVMTLIRGLNEAFIGYWQVMASLIVYDIKTIMETVYITGTWSVLADRKFLNALYNVELKNKDMP